MFDAYSPALAALSGFAVLMLVLAALSTFGRSSENRTESGMVKRNYADPAYRRARAFLNAIEIAGPFIAATLAAILSGVSAGWVNTLAMVFFLSRIAVAAVHIGTENQTLRSALWFVGLACVLLLALITFFGALF